MVVRRIGSGGAKLAENQVAVDAELDDANIRGEAEHGQEGNDGPVGRSRSVVLLPIHILDTRPERPLIKARYLLCEYFLKPLH